MTTDFFAVAGTQRACRDFTAEPVPDEALVTMVRCATHAPSAHNSQPWEFVIVQAAPTRARVSNLARQSWDASRDWVETNLLEQDMFRDVDQFIHERDYGGAPVLVVLGVDTNKVAEIVAGCSIYPAAQNLMLAAGALGYASAFTNFTVAASEAMSAEVGFPPEVKCYGVVAVGRAAKPLGPPRREPAESKMHRDYFGAKWPVKNTPRT